MKASFYCSGCNISYRIRWTEISQTQEYDPQEDLETDIDEDEHFPNLCPFCGSTTDEDCGE